MSFSSKEKKHIINLSKSWVENIIIGLNLCPFAKAPYLRDAVRFVPAEGRSINDFVKAFRDEVVFLQKNEKTDTTLLIAPSLQAIPDFRKVLEACEAEILKNKWYNDFLIVSFHPLMRFSEFKPDDPANTTGVAPYPVIHLLRKTQVDTLGAAAKKDIQAENVKKLRELGMPEIIKLWKRVFDGK